MELILKQQLHAWSIQFPASVPLHLLFPHLGASFSVIFQPTSTASSRCSVVNARLSSLSDSC